MTRCSPGACLPKRTKAGLWFCEKCEYNVATPRCYRLGCQKKAITVVVDKLAITPRKAVCEDHLAGAKFRT